MKMFFKKYWRLFILVIILAFLPLLINSCYYWKSDCSVLHAPSAWASFWATYLAAIASFAMVLITWWTLKQNKEQLEEIKRQWKEQNMPRVSCTLEKNSEHVLVELHNTSQVPAHKVGVRITNNSGENIPLFDKTCEWLGEMTFEIPPSSIKQIPILITPYIDGDYEGYLSVEVTYCGRDDKFDLYLKELNLATWKYSTKDICGTLEHLDTTIKNKKL